jgi:hypothetical protein
MKAYLARNLTINDFGGFRDYIAAIPAHFARHDGRTSSKALSLPAQHPRSQVCMGTTIEERGLKCKWVE